MERNTLFMISSVIYPTSKPLSYAPIRSVFSPEERALQTLTTIQSIRTAIPDSKILFIELGLKKDLPDNIESRVDKYLYLGNKKIIRNAVDSPFKGLGEAIGLYLANRWILSFNADYYFKLSGRYYLNEEFNVNDWNADGYTGMDYYGNFQTVFYGFPNRLYKNWRHSLRESMPTLLRGDAIEGVLPWYLDRPIHCLNKMGVSGWASANGGFGSL